MEFHNMQISDHRYLKKVFKDQRKKLNFAEEAPIAAIEVLKTNVMIWCSFFVDNYESRHSFWTKSRLNVRSFQEHKLRGTSEFIPYHAEIDVGLSIGDSECITDWLDSSSWARCALSHNEVITWTKPRVRVCSDSVLCLVKMSDHSEAHRTIISTVQFLQRIIWNWWRTDRVNISPGLTSLEILQKSLEDLQDRNIEPEKFKDRIISMSMFNDIGWTKRGNSENVFQIQKKLKKYAKSFSRGHWTFLGDADEKKLYGILSYSLEGKWDYTGSQMVERFKENWSSIIQEYQCFESWNSEKKEEQIYHTFQRGFIEHRTLDSHDLFSKSVEFLRSSLKLVWRVRSEAGWESRDKRKWAATEECETARSKCFGAKSKEWWSRIWKHMARTTSELRNTGERNPIYKSLRRCVILEKSLNWNVEFLHVENIHTRRTIIGPVIQDHVTQFLGNHGIHIQIPSTPTPHRNSWVVTCRWKNRYVDEQHLRDPGHNPTSSDVLLGRSVAKESEHCCSELEHSRIEENHATQSKI